MELVNQVHACSDAKVGAFADLYAKRLDKARAVVPGAAVAGDYRALLDDPTLDAVIIATPTHLRAQPFIDALESGKHVYIEKTLALTVADAKRMRRAYRKDNGKHVVQVGHQACSSGHIADVKQFVADPERMGRIASIHMRNYRNTPKGKAQWARPALFNEVRANELSSSNFSWAAFSGQDHVSQSGEAEFDANRFVHWRYFWDYSGGPVTENMSQQLAFWYKTLALKIPERATMSGGVYVWDDGRETPDTVDVALHQPEHMLIHWASGFGNNQMGVGEEALGTAGTISRASQIRYIPQKMHRPDGNEMAGRATSLPHSHMQNFLDSIRLSREPNAPFELGFRVAIACRMAVESYLQKRTVHWDAAAEEIV